MSDGAGHHESDAGTRSATHSAAEQGSSGLPEQHDGRWTLDEHGVWRERAGNTGTPPPRPRTKLGVVGWLGAAGVLGVAATLMLSQLGVFGSKKAPSVSGFQPTATKPALAARQTADAFLAAWQHGHLRKAARY